jgi:hypothetical protein
VAACQELRLSLHRNSRYASRSQKRPKNRSNKEKKRPTDVSAFAATLGMLAGHFCSWLGLFQGSFDPCTFLSRRRPPSTHELHSRTPLTNSTHEIHSSVAEGLPLVLEHQAFARTQAFAGAGAGGSVSCGGGGSGGGGGYVDGATDLGRHPGNTYVSTGNTYVGTPQVSPTVSGEKPSALETVLLWVSNEDTGPAARTLCREVAGNLVGLFCSLLLALPRLF